jgi:predicted RNA binding protein YcfA (HicA-like mRNA interferase family)
MPKFPAVKGKQLLKILKRINYEVDHIQGSHYVLRRNDGKKTTIPIHGNLEIPKGTLFGILNDVDISKEEFLVLIKKMKS